MTYLLLVVGLLLLLGGAEFLVKGAAGLASRLGISPFLIGLTLVGFGTSSPELVASLQGAFEGYPGIAVGNVIGSNIANILLILGASGLIFPLLCDRNVLKRDGTMMLLAAAILIAVCLMGELSRAAGFAFLALLAVYLVYTYRADKKGQDGAGELHAAEAEFLKARHPMSLVIEIVMAAGGLVSLVVGASLLVDAAVEIATGLGVSDSVVGLTIVAVGTSLPELATSVLAAFRRKADIAIGNVVGSNIFNVLGIAGVVAAVKPVPIPGDIASFDIWVMGAASILFMVFAWSGARIGRVEALLLLIGYGAYVTFLLR
ncbi:calcium/sodium antiporter [Parvibaculum sp.]|uniref:calcium/sodium antiporter n=1 Tax=Parvibaculum sp. TaxID=2024848 RepID=UPI000C542E94|nr:calcium/sodium antiporter [Parvibaculum sp.]MAU59944.1 sodium:calcium antiporter [Parvibaculum sp.]MBO6668885.1 calcium/sodium antiporter [Parvibaculum sp.]MBO6692438.1 calcium/sodium antiporter [Parvibaculum sp.]MBO6715745.1 calcium/sodium antiporter [Parvibaculum sp.]